MYYLTDIMYRDKIRTVTNKNLMLEKPAQGNDYDQIPRIR